MRIFALFIWLCLLAFPATAQIVHVNLTTLATNMTTSSAQITIAGVCSSANYTVVNSSNIVIGDPIPTAFGEINGDFDYITNILGVLSQAPYQYNTNLSNWVSFTTNLAVTSSNSLLSASNVLAGRITSAVAYAGGTSNTLWHFFSTNIPSGGTMNFDGGLITSDGQGDISLTGQDGFPISITSAVPTANGYTLFHIGNGVGNVYLGEVDAGQTFLQFNGSIFQFDNGTFGNLGAIAASQLGVNTTTPAYDVDVVGDINYTGTLRWGGNPVIEADSGGMGGTTLELNASDTGTPMYIHVTSLGVITATSSP